MRSRIVGTTVAGTLVGLLLGLLLMTPLALYLREPMGWDDSRPDVFFLGTGLLWLAWTGYLGGRFGYKVGTYEDPAVAVPGSLGTWSGPGWSLAIGAGSVEVTTSRGTKTYTGADANGAFLVRTGRSWQLELPDDSIHVLEGLTPHEALEIQQACRRISAG